MTDRDYLRRERRRLRAKTLHRWKPEPPKPPCHHAFRLLSERDESYICTKCGLRVTRHELLQWGPRYLARPQPLR